MEDLRAFLLGEWSVSRTINGDQGAFAGDAVFADDGAGGLRWRETGILRLGSHTGKAQRSYLIHPAGHGSWTVSFDDGRPFHPLDLRADRCAVVHHCGPDVYRGVYALDDDGSLHVSWRVVGPERSDAIDSDYRRRVM